jgi:hypothetical protein
VEKTSVSLWTKLENLYMTKSLTNKIFLKRKLYSLCMKEGTKIVYHLNIFNTLLVQLTSMGVKFESEDKAITLLCSFPMPWDHFVTSISFSTIESIEFDVIVGALMSKETRKKSNSETSTSEVMMVRGRPKERGHGQRDFSWSKLKGKNIKIKCWFCGKSRHLKKDCWKRQQASKDDPPKETKEANATKTGSATSSVMTNEVLSISIGSRHDQQWLLDSSASNHMCLHRH